VGCTVVHARGFVNIGRQFLTYGGKETRKAFDGQPQSVQTFCAIYLKITCKLSKTYLLLRRFLVQRVRTLTRMKKCLPFQLLFLFPGFPTNFTQRSHEMKVICTTPLKKSAIILSVNVFTGIIAQKYISRVSSSGPGI